MQEIIRWLEDIDKAVFLFIYRDLYQPWFRVFFEFISNSRNWYIPLGLGWLWLMFRGGKGGRACALLLIPLFAVTDFGTASILKPFFGRSRPLGHLGYSFPSVHAVNSFAVAALVSLFFRHWIVRTVLLSIAALVAFSRVYISVHYPADILAGAVIGALEALLIYQLYRLIFPARLQANEIPVSDTQSEDAQEDPGTSPEMKG